MTGTTLLAGRKYGFIPVLQAGEGEVEGALAPGPPAEEESRESARIKS
jgi:hypothetical protein